MIYLIGSLRNPKIPYLANQLRAAGWDIFDDWFACGPETDEKWQEYEKIRGRPYSEAIHGAHAEDVFAFDLRNLQKSDGCVLALPAGKSAHLELGWMLGKGRPGWILLDGEPERYDIMYQFATGIYTTVNKLTEGMEEYYAPIHKDVNTGYFVGLRSA